MKDAPPHKSGSSAPGRSSGSLTHLDAGGDATMVDVEHKDVTARRAVARGVLRCSSRAFALLTGDANPKGDVQQVARVAGIMAGKRTGELIPLCHILPGASVSVQIEPDATLPGLRATATATIAGRTGVEMEALTAVSVALLTAYDMLKAVDRGMRIESVELVEKAGGRSGEWQRDEGAGKE
ncbi:MAG: cyclic pyranopterin monophosphate synthase MoaC [Gemmatimonadetes bacterium]|nr:cyclic pyranopterin monophosphate synthase MoaC [Gemmatimonadota bacterium]